MKIRVTNYGNKHDALFKSIPAKTILLRITLIIVSVIMQV